MAFDINKWIQDIKKGHEELLFYSGPITSEVVTEYIEAIESLSQKMTLPRTLEKRMVHVAIESIQNLFHHSCQDADNPEIKHFGVFFLSIKENCLYLTTGNYIKQESILFLKNRLDQLNALDMDGIKKIYKVILNGTKLSSKGGGGLGMIDIIKKTKNKLEYNFHTITDEYSFYEFKVKIGEIES